MTAGNTDLLQIECELQALDQPQPDRPNFTLAATLERAVDVVRRHGDEIRARRLFWEFEAWRLFPTHAWEQQKGSHFRSMLTYDDGSVWPDLSGFPDEQLDHLAVRAATTANPAIRAHYADVLWERRRTVQHGQIAFDAYVEMATAGLQADIVSIDLLHAITRPLSLSLALNNSDLLVQARGLVNDALDRFAERDRFRQCLNLADALLSRAKRVEHSDLVHAAEVTEQAALRFAQSVDGLGERDALDLATRLHRKLGAPEPDLDGFRERIARSHVREGEQQEPESALAASHAYRQALAAFQQLGRVRYAAEIDDLERRIQDQNQRGGEASTRSEQEVQLDYAEVDHLVDQLLSLDGLDDLHALGALNGFIPSVSQVRTAAAESLPDLPLLSQIRRETIRHGKVVDIARSSDEIFDAIVDNDYEFWLGHQILQLDRLVERMSAAKRWRRARLMRVFRAAPVFRGRDLRLLDHAMRRYFYRDYVSAVQLLALQIEPALRAILPLLGFATSTTDPSTNTAREKNLDEVLATPELKQLLGEDYVYFVRFTLTSQRGFLLRHATAHGLLPAEKCRPELAHLLVYMLLWLTRFAVSPKFSDEQAASPSRGK